MPLTLVTSHRPGLLAARLAHDLGRAPLSPFAEEVVVVQSRGMARWVRQELARRHGCAASLALPFPAAFAHRLAGALDALPLDPRFERDALTWRVLQLLEEGLAADADFAALRLFDDGADTRKRLGLAARVAARFDDYQLYRPDALLAWERGGDPAPHGPAERWQAARWQAERWQAALWRRLCAPMADADLATGDPALPPRHLARWLTDAVARLQRGDVPADALPARVSVFGVSTLPPLFVELLGAVARHVPVRAYLLAPPRAAWDAGPAAAGPAAGDPLFRAFGGASRDLLARLAAATPDVTVEEHHPQDAPSAPSAPSMLARLQADLRDGVVRGPEPGAAAPVPLAPDDRSLTVHVCHSPMREMEVLRDQLLDALAADSTLRPHDLLVLVPDIATHAPFVDAVFGVAEPGVPRLPFHIADRPLLQESSAADAFLRLLRLAGARWTAAEVVELLDLPFLRRAAGIPAGAVGRVLGWVQQTGIRWGRDGATRRDRFGLPAVEANSWQAGMDRLLVGYAVGPVDALVDGVLPSAGHTVGDPDTLGALAQWLDRLFDALDALREPRGLAEWAAALRRLAGEFLLAEGDDEARDVAALQGAVDALAASGHSAGHARAVDLAVVRDWLELALAGEGLGGGFLGGGMTVCALKPMRAIPFRVIAVAGLDDAAFPRRDRRASHDLLELDPRPGDRDARADDRQLFLDTLLAAGDRVVLSYVGRSATTNAERAPSVVLAELLDHVDRAFQAPTPDPHARPSRARVRDRVVVEHRLQPFSRAYYDAYADGRLFSYSRVHARAAGVAGGVAGGARAAPPFVTAPTPAPPTGAAGPGAVIPLADLAECWTNASRWYCQRVLRLRLADGAERLDECEPLGVDRLLEYDVHAGILDRHLRGRRDPAHERALAVARGHLPPGELAGRWFDRMDRGLAAFLERIDCPTLYEPVAVEVRGPDWTLVGRVDGLTDRGRLQVRPARCRPRDLVEGWIAHLALAAEHGDVPPGRVIGTDAGWEFLPVADPIRRLDALVGGWRASAAAPIPVFERASHAYVERLRTQEANSDGRATKSPADCARAAYVGGDFPEAPDGDQADPYVALCWRARDPLEDEAAFAAWAEVLWRPLLDHARPVAEWSA